VKALILNSGTGSRMGALTSEHPKCMTEIGAGETILSRQLKLLSQCGIREIVMTTGLFDQVLMDYCDSLRLPLAYTFVKNPVYDRTNYIYSIYMARDYLKADLLLLHGDLVFEQSVLQEVLAGKVSCMTVSSTSPLPPKDFKAVISAGRIEKVGIEFFENAMTAQPLYKLNYTDWKVWLDKIITFCETGQVSCYAENAFNQIADDCPIYSLDYQERLCNEIDTPEDLVVIIERLSGLK
jgi:choline kinase